MPGWRVRELSRSVVLDSAAWRVRTPPGSTRGWLAPSGDVMLVNARPGSHKAFPPFRLLAYDRDGSVRYRLDGRRDRLFTWLVGDGLLYAGTRSGEMTHIFELGTGKLLRKVPPRELAFDLQPAAFRWTPPD